MEYLDIYNSDGSLTGEKKSKKEAHEKGLLHKTVHIWFINSNKEVLIQKRSPLMDSYPNKWDISVAGHISAGEDVLTSALRETKEEIGLKLKADDLIKIGELRQSSQREDYINNEINSIYIVKMDLDVDSLIKQPEEVSELKYIPYQKLKTIVKNEDPSFVPRVEEYKLLFDYIDNF